ncbi:hypothetical protein WN943_019064 [Citrus x changshan-huyou]
MASNAAINCSIIDFSSKNHQLIFTSLPIPHCRYGSSTVRFRRNCFSLRASKSYHSPIIRADSSSSSSSSSSVKREPMLPPYNVLITGSTKGIGYALAKEFLKAGDNVIICSRSVHVGLSGKMIMQGTIWVLVNLESEKWQQWLEGIFYNMLKNAVRYLDPQSVLYTVGLGHRPRSDVLDGKGNNFLLGEGIWLRIPIKMDIFLGSALGYTQPCEDFGLRFCTPSTERVDSAVQSLREEFGEQHVWGTKCDVSEGNEVADLVAFAQKNLKYVDIWVFMSDLHSSS